MRRIATIGLLIGACAALVAAVVIQPRVGHPVTPWMSDAAAATKGREVAALPGLKPGRAMVVIFILPGCPCSEEYEPFTHQLFHAHDPDVDFLGVVVGDTEEAKVWQREHGTPYPVMADPDRRIAASFRAERSAYTALITDGKTVDRLWPGYSEDTLQDLNSRLTKRAQRGEVPIDFKEAPNSPTSGCHLGIR